ncbi:indole-3-glycerol phosphate synthase TrpC [Heliophilum fasciatum]|nr:indole-3-glycerol phosphate synthase TrpC [Heliophilum fasciatum]
MGRNQEYRPEGFLATMAELQAERVKKAQAEVALEQYQALAQATPPALDFAQALTRTADGPLRVIAEVKRSSPSKGALAPVADARALAAAYMQGGAAAVSILTEEAYFHGALADLQQVRPALAIPMLRKDFLIDPYQVWEARAYGADAVLLIAALLGPAKLTEMTGVVLAAGMQPLIELHAPAEVAWAEAAIEVNAKGYGDRRPVVGVNARNLMTLQVEPAKAWELLRALPNHWIRVAESGLRTRQDLMAAREAGADAALIGEALVTSGEPSRAIAELIR